MRRLIEGLQVFPERMLDNLDASHGLVFSQPVLLALVQAGMTRDDAYRVVQRQRHAGVGARACRSARCVERDPG